MFVEMEQPGGVKGGFVGEQLLSLECSLAAKVALSAKAAARALSNFSAPARSASKAARNSTKASASGSIIFDLNELSFERDKRSCSSDTRAPSLVTSATTLRNKFPGRLSINHNII